MARAKKSISKSEKPSADEKTDAENASSAASEEVQDAIILEEADQVGVPETTGTDKTETDESSETADTEEHLISTTNSEQPVAVPAGRKSVFFPMLIGGACAAALGFGTSQYLGNDSWPFARDNSTVDQLSARVQDQSANIETMTAKLATLQSEIVEATTLQSSQSEIQNTLNELNANLANTNQRITDLENRPIPDVGATRDAVAAYQDQLAGMRAMFEDELARIEASQMQAAEQEQTAAERAKLATVRANVAQLKTAIDNGSPFVDILDTLTIHGADVPPILVQNAKNGVQTLATLQQNFPAAARQALKDSIRAQANSGEIDKFTAFLRTQLGTRSLQPKEGSDPDAVLSRAEAALRNGDLSGTLSELADLPPAGAEQMADWSAKARTREAAVNAVAVLLETLNN